MALAAATDELCHALGRAPTVNEIADHLQVSEDDLLEALESAYSTLSLDAPESAQIDGGSLGDSLGYADDALDTVELRESLRLVLETLLRRERTIVCLRFFASSPSRRSPPRVGMVQMHASRLLSRSLSVLRTELDPEPADRRQVSARVVAGSTNSTSATTAIPATRAATSG